MHNHPWYGYGPPIYYGQPYPIPPRRRRRRASPRPEEHWTLDQLLEAKQVMDTYNAFIEAEIKRREEDKKKNDKPKDNKYNPFANRSKLEVFLIAMAVGPLIGALITLKYF